MNKFEKQLEKWNEGTLRGAQAKLARILKVSTATVALWTTGKRRPSKGYASKMADLFQLDVYHLMRLFDSTTTYPEAGEPSKPLTLRDKENADFTYNLPPSPAAKIRTQSNSVSLPFLATAPDSYPKYDESEIIEWWTLPRRFAKGAKYLIRTPETEKSLQRDDLYFVKPAAKPEEGQIMLLKIDGVPSIRRVRLEADFLLLCRADGSGAERFAASRIRTLGVAVRKIMDLE